MDDTTREDAIALVDGLSSPRYEVQRRDLSLVQLREVAIDAAQQGFCEVALGHHDRAAGAVATSAEQLIVSADDTSPDGWARKGARDGIIMTWERLPAQPPSINGEALDLYTYAFGGTSSIVFRLVADENKRREAEEKRS